MAGIRAYTMCIGAPAFEVDGEFIPVVLIKIAQRNPPVRLLNGTTEYRLGGAIDGAEHLQLDWVARLPDGANPVIRFRYELTSNESSRLTKKSGNDRLRYDIISMNELPQAAEIRFSAFMETVHSFCLDERPLDSRHFGNGESVMGPIVTAGDGTRQMLIAYEHGSQVPDAFIRFRLSADRKSVIEAVKGNYYDGYPLSPDHPYRTVWLQVACRIGGMEELAAAYREFVLLHFTLNTESRKPYIFYNT